VFFHQSVTRVRAPETIDRYRNRVRDWSQATRTTFSDVSVQPAARAEDHSPGERDRITTGWTLQSRPGVDLDILPTDRIELADGTACEVVGEIARHPDPFGRVAVHHVEVALQRVTG
jgi:hypothetical protein